jgi:hypothetical protein
MLESSLDLEILGFFFSWRLWAIFPKESFAKVTVDFLLLPRGKKFNTSKNADCQGLKPLGEYQTL